MFSIYYRIRYFLGKKKKALSEMWHTVFVPAEIERLRALRNAYSDKDRCFIIGNGPSLNSMDLNLMKNDIVFCSNSFFLKFNDLEFTPSFITVEDHLVAEDNFEVFNNLKGIKKIFPIDLRHILADDCETYWVNFRRAFLNIRKDGNFKFNVQEDIFYWGGTVLYMNLQLAAFMGFKKIYLIGVDLSYSIPKDASIAGSVITSNSDDPNHFDGTYFGKGKRWHLPETQRMQNSFVNAHSSLSESGISLFNATYGGNLKDVPRVDYNSLFEL